MSERVRIEIEARDAFSSVFKSLQTDLDKVDAGQKGATTSGGALSGQMAGLGMAMLGPLAGAASLTGAYKLLSEAFKAIIQGASEDESALTSLQATLLSTGRAGEMSAESILKFGEGLSGLFDDSKIAAAATALARLMDIPADQIPEDLALIENMAVGLETDLAGAANTLGMALETGRVRGMGFSREMTNTISKMMSAGDVAGADAIIMEQLNQKFSGQAAASLMTYAGATQAVDTSLDKLGATIGGPYLDNLTLAKLAFSDLINEYIVWQTLQNGGRDYGLGAYAGKVDYAKMSTDKLNAALAFEEIQLKKTTTVTGKAMIGHAELAIKTELAARANMDLGLSLDGIPGYLQKITIAEDAAAAGAADLTDAEKAAIKALTEEYQNMNSWATSYDKSNAELYQAESDLAALRKAGWGEHSTKITEAKQKVDDLKAAEALETSQFVADALLKVFMVGGMSTEEETFYNNYLLKTGLLHQEDLDRAKSVQDMVNQELGWFAALNGHSTWTVDIQATGGWDNAQQWLDSHGGGGGSGGGGSVTPPPHGPIIGIDPLTHTPIYGPAAYASGASYASGLFMAGEGGRGGEYVYAPGGATVFNAKQTQAMQDVLKQQQGESLQYFYGPVTLVLQDENARNDLLSIR